MYLPSIHLSIFCHQHSTIFMTILRCEHRWSPSERPKIHYQPGLSCRTSEFCGSCDLLSMGRVLSALKWVSLGQSLFESSANMGDHPGKNLYFWNSMNNLQEAWIESLFFLAFCFYCYSSKDPNLGICVSIRYGSG